MKQTNLLQTTVCGKIFLSCLLAAATIVGWPTVARANTYYIDFVAGADSNNGTTAASAWKHCPGDGNATSTANSAKLQPGDNVLFNAASQYLGGNGINIQWSGTQGNPITYGTYGTGRAVINGQNLTNTSVGLWGNACSYLVFNNLEVCNIQVHNPSSVTCNNPYPYPVPTAMSFQNFQQVTISNCFLHDVGDFTNAPNYSVAWMYGYGINLFGNAGNITITNCEFTHIAKTGINLSAGYAAVGAMTNIAINNCLMHDFVVWGICVATENNNSIIQDVVIDGLVWSNYWQYSPNEWIGCAGAFPHTDGIIMFLAGSPLPVNCQLGTPAHPFVIRNCTFINNATNENDTAGTADIFPCPWGGTILMYNNTAINVLNAGEGFFFTDGDIPTGNGTTPADFRLFNNTCLDTNHLMVDIFGMTNTSSKITVNNNIFYNYANGGGFIPLGIDSPSLANSTIVVDYNLYKDFTNANGIAKIGNTSANFSQLQALGFEKHGKYADPQFTYFAGFGPNSSLNNVHLTATSPAIAMGTNLSALFSVDKAGNPRPATAAWDVGAYQFAVSPLTAPTGLHIVQ